MIARKNPRSNAISKLQHGARFRAGQANTVSRVAAIAESQPGYEVELVYAVMAPAGTPRDIISRRNVELGCARNATDTREHLVGQGFEVRSSTPEQLGDYIASEITKWEPIVKESGAKPE